MGGEGGEGGGKNPSKVLAAEAPDPGPPVVDGKIQDRIIDASCVLAPEESTSTHTHTHTYTQRQR